jgi:serine/threonine protein kinase
MEENILDQLITDPELFVYNYRRNPPDFLYNDNQVCCLLRETEEVETCPGVNKGYLGKRGKVGVPYLVEIDGQTLILKTVQTEPLSIIYRHEPPSSLKAFDQALKVRCEFPEVASLRYLGADEFTNEMLIGLVLTDYFQYWNEETHNNFYPQVAYLYSSVCQDVSPIGVHLLEYADKGTLVDIANGLSGEEYRVPLDVIDATRGDLKLEVVKPEVILLILKQVTTALDILQKSFAFNHGDLKAANIFVSSESSEGEYLGVDISAPFTCKIADYGKSSLTLETEHGPFRIYHRSWLADRYLSVVPFVPKTNLDQGEPYFVIPASWSPHLYTRTRHMGLPFYLAFDTYTFLISILLLPAYYYSFFSTSQLVEAAWNPLWLNQREADIVKSRIQREHSNPRAQSLAISMDLLKNIRLRCNATSVLLSGLQGIKRNKEMPKAV